MENKFLLGIGVDKGNQLWTIKKEKRKKNIQRIRESCKMERLKHQPATQLAYIKREGRFKQIQN